MDSHTFLFSNFRFITQESNQLKAQIRPPKEITNAVSWRPEGIRYKKNEVFLDVVESVNILVNASGDVVRSEILGVVKMRCYLSGMPELRLGLNDKAMFESIGRGASFAFKPVLLVPPDEILESGGKAVEMEDVQFHHCVRLSRFETNRTISFIPPDGDFDLMTYRLSTIVKPLIWVEAEIERHSETRVVYMVKVIAQYKRKSTANNVEIFVPVAPDADTPRFKASCVLTSLLMQ
jgi:AP-1 complex subunit mu